MPNADPAGVNPIIRLFTRNLTSRFRWLKGEIRQHVGVDDAYNLTPKSVRTLQYEFATSQQKLDGFMQWLRRREEQGLLRSYEGPGQSVAGYQHWSDIYIESGYKKGMADAYSYGGYEAATGIDQEAWLQANFYTPINADRVGLLYTRTFNELRGITDAMDQQMSSVFAEGMADGLHPMQIARNLNDRVDKIGITRARMLARTEVMRAHAEAALNTYESFQEQGLVLRLEWSTAQDNNVCPKCEKRSSNADGSPKVYTIEEARGLIPLHPNCRCVWIPYTV